MIPLEAHFGNGLFFLIFGMLFGIPILLIIIGALLRKRYQKASTVFFILAVLYVIIGLGICSSMV